MFERFALKEAANLTGGNPRGFFSGLLAGPGDMRRHYDVRGFQQARVRRDWLFGKYVEAATPEVAGVKRIANGVVIDERAASAVDEHRPGRHHSQLFRADHALGFGCRASVQGNDARAGKQFFEPDILRQVAEGLRLGVGIIREHVTSEATENPGHAAADRAVADQAGGGILQFQPALVVFVVIAAPFALRERGMRFGNAAQDGKDEAYGVLGGGCGVAPGGVTDEHAVLGCRLDVGVGWTSARDDSKFQVRRALDYFLREGSMIRHVDVHPLKSLDNFVLRAGRFRDLTDPAERHAGPGRSIFAELKRGLYFGADRLGKDGRQDEVVAGDKDACAHDI